MTRLESYIFNTISIKIYFSIKVAKWYLVENSHNYGICLIVFIDYRLMRFPRVCDFRWHLRSNSLQLTHMAHGWRPRVATPREARSTVSFSARPRRPTQRATHTAHSTHIDSPGTFSSDRVPSRALHCLWVPSSP